MGIIEIPPFLTPPNVIASIAELNKRRFSLSFNLYPKPPKITNKSNGKKKTYLNTTTTKIHGRNPD